ncbi:unnamed protein product [Orchesella dallaii]|uniref:EF-hand domain-containing protein n=1 Tax=Orchesella dallaii TaxID=48710 RepID=A0ABP1R7B4_9HEXA
MGRKRRSVGQTAITKRRNIKHKISLSPPLIGVNDVVDEVGKAMEDHSKSGYCDDDEDDDDDRAAGNGSSVTQYQGRTNDFACEDIQNQGYITKSDFDAFARSMTSYQNTTDDFPAHDS